MNYILLSNRFNTLQRFAFCEAACRTGGAGVAAATKQLFGVDLNKACVQAQLLDVPLTSPIPPGNETWCSQIRHSNNADVAVHVSQTKINECFINACTVSGGVYWLGCRIWRP